MIDARAWSRFFRLSKISSAGLPVSSSCFSGVAFTSHSHRSTRGIKALIWSQDAKPLVSTAVCKPAAFAALNNDDEKSK